MPNIYLVFFWALQVLGWHLLLNHKPYMAIFTFVWAMVFGIWYIATSIRVK